MSNVPKCSIVMATRDKSPSLDLVLKSIAKQTVPFQYEVIVADDGSTDETADVCRSHGVEYHYIDNDRYRNPSVARNVGYRAARGEVIIAQSDEVIHISPNAIEFLANELRQGEFLLANVNDYEYVDGKPHTFVQEYVGLIRRKPFFFLGSCWRSDLYAVGGNDEEFVEPCYDDDWFAECLINGLKLTPRYLTEIEGHHVHHSYVKGSHVNEEVSKKLYEAKVNEAAKTGVYMSSGGPWEINATR